VFLTKQEEYMLKVYEELEGYRKHAEKQEELMKAFKNRISWKIAEPLRAVNRLYGKTKGIIKQKIKGSK